MSLSISDLDMKYTKKYVLMGTSAILFAIVLAILNSVWIPYVGEIRLRIISLLVGAMGLLLVIKGASNN
jgi:hypothetical protein